MKFAVDILTNKLKAAYRDDDNSKLPGCYIINFPGEFDRTKTLKKANWTHLKDEKGNLLVENNKPVKGFEVSNDNIEVNVNHHLSLFTIDDILEYKYEKKRKALGFTNVIYNEIIEHIKEENKGLFEGTVSIGKKYLKGEMLLSFVDQFKELKNGKFGFDCEFDKQLPDLEISVDKNKWVKIDEVPFTHTFRNYGDCFYLKMNDSVNALNAFSIYYNTESNH